MQALGSDLAFVRATESRQALIDLVHEMGAQAVVFNHLYDPISLVRDNEVKTAMQKMQVEFLTVSGESSKARPVQLVQDGEPEN